LRVLTFRGHFRCCFVARVVDVAVNIAAVVAAIVAVVGVVVVAGSVA